MNLLAAGIGAMAAVLAFWRSTCIGLPAVRVPMSVSVVPSSNPVEYSFVPYTERVG